MSIHRRLRRLDRHGDDRRCGPDCPPSWGRILRQDGPEGEPVVREALGSDQPCPRCGRPAEQVEDLTEIVVDDPADWQALKDQG
jgi:hypothetical protein